MARFRSLKQFKVWPCGCDVGNPWHFDCKDERCKSASRASGEPLGISCVGVIVRPRKTGRGK